jgi:hypothetical protein
MPAGLGRRPFWKIAEREVEAWLAATDELGAYLPPPILAGTGPARYIDGLNGSDANDGLGTGTAWKTIGKAFDDANANPNAGRTYFIRGGVYKENLTKTVASSEGKAPTFTNYPGEQVIWQWPQTVTTQSHTLPVGTLNVGDTTGFPSSGTVHCYNDAGVPLRQAIAYTGKTAATFTGCSGGSGTIPSGAYVMASQQVLQLLNCAYVRIVGTNVGLEKGIVLDGLYCRSASDNNAVLYFSGTSHHVLAENIEIRHGYDHGSLTDTQTHHCEISRSYFHDGGSGPAYPLSSALQTGGAPGLAASAYFYKVHVIYECGAIGTHDGGLNSANAIETTKTADAVNNAILVSWPANPRATGYRIWRGTTAGGQDRYIDVAAGATSLLDQGQAFTVATYSSANSNRDHAQYLEGQAHYFHDNILAYWDFGHVLQVYPTADDAIICNNLIIRSPYSPGTSGLWHDAAIVIGSDTGGISSDARIYNNILAYCAQGIYGYTSLGQVTSLSGGLTLPNDASTLFNITVASAAGFEADGQIVIGNASRLEVALVRYESIAGAVLQNCRRIGGLGQVLSWPSGEQVRSNPPGVIGGFGNIAGRNLYYRNTYTDERNDPTSNGAAPIVDFLSGTGLDADPRFRNEAGRDYRLDASSPAIGAGIPEWTALVDFDGNVRTRADIGPLAFVPDEGQLGADPSLARFLIPGFRGPRRRPFVEQRPDIFGPLGTVYEIGLDGSITPVGALANQAQKGLVGAVSPSGLLARLAGKVLGGSVSPGGGLAKLVSKLAAGSISPSGALSTLKIVLLSLAGSISPSGALAKQVQKGLAGAISPSGLPARLVTKALGGSISPAGATAKQVQKKATGSISPAGALGLIKVVLLAFAGSISPTGALAKQDQKAASGSVTPAGALSRQAQKGLGGSVSPIGALARLVSRLLVGSVSPAGLTAKLASRKYAGTVSPAGAIAKQPQKGLAGSVTPAGAVARFVSKALVGAITPLGTLSKSIGKRLVGLISPIGDLLRSVHGADVPGTVAVSDVPNAVVALEDVHAADVGLKTIAGGDVGLSDLTP